jgi:hypothetical protein
MLGTTQLMTQHHTAEDLNLQHLFCLQPLPLILQAAAVLRDSFTVSTVQW